MNTFLRTAEIGISIDEDGITFRDMRIEDYRDGLDLFVSFLTK